MKQNEKEARYLSILDSNKEKIYRICHSFSDDPEHARDLAQEVYLNIWKSLDSFRGKSHVNTWVYRITINICLRAKTKINKQKKRTSLLDGIDIQQFPAPDDENKDYSELYQCIKALEEFDRTIILLYLEELPYKEISRICDITENYVAVKIKRIKDELLTCLKSNNYGR